MASSATHSGNSPDRDYDQGVDTGVEIPSFQTNDESKSPPSFQLPDETWLTALSSICSFKADVFEDIMLNLIKNPNITSSHLFRADILYDSDKDGSLIKSSGHGLLNGLLDHIKPEYRPITITAPGYTVQRTIVRQLVPRNPQLDNPLIQTCHILQKHEHGEAITAVLYIPHIQDPEHMPFYHPQVSRLAFTHRWRISNHNSESQGTIAVSYNLSPNHDYSIKLQRTALRLLETLHKHGHGRLKGYEKRVHHDQIIEQKRYQDTYTRLKTKYAKQLADDWVEVTDPGKHVFEDLGIAAFLIEMWNDMYDCSAASDDTNGTRPSNGDAATNGDKPPFPGFVDIGCGNGVLTHLLLSEGYPGSGFDARERKTWKIFPEPIQSQLSARLLVPEILCTEGQKDEDWVSGRFGEGTFIISNHADELTAWTPLLAYWNRSAFVAIPCCSHDLAGARFRAPEFTKAAKQAQKNANAPTRLPQQAGTNGDANLSEKMATCEINGETAKKSLAAETGSLKKNLAQKKMGSAYATLCSYVFSLAEEVGFEAEKEILRIPSTRNTCIVGRRRREQGDGADFEERAAKVKEVVERELGKPIEWVGKEWIERAQKLAKKPGSGH